MLDTDFRFMGKKNDDGEYTVNNLKGIVTFGIGDRRMATAIGIERFVRSRELGLELSNFSIKQAVDIVGKNKTERERDGIERAIQDDVLGAMGEQAFCVFAEKPWRGYVNTFKWADVDPNTQVRTAWGRDLSLVIRRCSLDPTLKNEDDVFLNNFVFVTPDCGRVHTTEERREVIEKCEKFIIHGFYWIEGYEDEETLTDNDIFKDEWIRNPGGLGEAYFIPIDELSNDFYNKGLTNWHDDKIVTVYSDRYMNEYSPIIHYDESVKNARARCNAEIESCDASVKGALESIRARTKTSKSDGELISCVRSIKMQPDNYLGSAIWHRVEGNLFQFNVKGITNGM